MQAKMVCNKTIVPYLLLSPSYYLYLLPFFLFNDEEHPRRRSTLHRTEEDSVFRRAEGQFRHPPRKHQVRVGGSPRHRAQRFTLRQQLLQRALVVAPMGLQPFREERKQICQMDDKVVWQAPRADESGESHPACLCGQECASQQRLFPRGCGL